MVPLPVMVTYFSTLLAPLKKNMTRILALPDPAVVALIVATTWPPEFAFVTERLRIASGVLGEGFAEVGAGAGFDGATEGASDGSMDGDGSRDGDGSTVSEMAGSGVAAASTCGVPGEVKARAAALPAVIASTAEITRAIRARFGKRCTHEGLGSFKVIAAG